MANHGPGRPKGSIVRQTWWWSSGTPYSSIICRLGGASLSRGSGSTRDIHRREHCRRLVVASQRIQACHSPHYAPDRRRSRLESIQVCNDNDEWREVAFPPLQSLEHFAPAPRGAIAECATVGFNIKVNHLLAVHTAIVFNWPWLLLALAAEIGH